MSQKIFIKTFGCQMNEYDSNRIYDSVKKIGYDKTENYIDANCYLLNTCHIRDKAKEKVYHEIGRVKKIFRNKQKPLVIVTGCVAQAENKEMLKREPYIDFVIGPQSYHKINETILNHKKKKQKNEETEFDAVSKFNYLSKLKNQSGKISSFLTVQEGCDKFCHFCVVPYTRGPEYSRPVNQIVDEAKLLIENGTKEIILLGQNVNAYHSNGSKLSDLIIEIEKFSEIKRIKFINSYSFIFSPRPGTVAADLELIDKKISIERLEKIQNQLFENQLIMNKSLENKTLSVLVENKTDDGKRVFGRSEYMTSVVFDGKKSDIGKVIQVKIKKSNRSTLFGERINNLNQKVA